MLYLLSIPFKILGLLLIPFKIIVTTALRTVGTFVGLALVILIIWLVVTRC
ncbi:MAG: hypothetical protein V3S51_04670 [Dehalococcoidia bacterium]